MWASWIYTPCSFNLCSKDLTAKPDLNFCVESSCGGKRKGCTPPDMGLEPMTLRLKVWCSTDWANRAGHHFQPVLYLPSKYWDRFSWERLYPVWIWILKNAHEKLLVASTVLLVLKLLLYGIFPLRSRCTTVQRCVSGKILSDFWIEDRLIYHDYRTRLWKVKSKNSCSQRH